MVSHSWLPARSRFGSPLSAPRSASGSVPHSALGWFLAPLQVPFPPLGPQFGSPLSAPGSAPRSGLHSRLRVRFPTRPLVRFPAPPPVRFPARSPTPPPPASVLARLPPFSVFPHLPRLRFEVCLQGRGRFLRPSRRQHVLPWQLSPGKPVRARASTGARRASRGLSWQCWGAREDLRNCTHQLDVRRQSLHSYGVCFI